ncbi:MAG: carboxypeptidase regulatory-like domain-containing protein [Chloroflexi bacterium]|nr:carboxypeptidase regulatory-like domain-containing protein [Chloroflexota bacterium]
MADSMRAFHWFLKGISTTAGAAAALTIVALAVGAGVLVTAGSGSEPGSKQGCVAVGFTGFQLATFTDWNLFNESAAEAAQINAESGVMVMLQSATNDESARSIRRWYDYEKDKQSLVAQVKRFSSTRKVVLVGYSAGGAAAVRLSRDLADEGINVDLLIEMDTYRDTLPTMGLVLSDLGTLPDRVKMDLNYYQSQGLPNGSARGEHAAQDIPVVMDLDLVPTHIKLEWEVVNNYPEWRHELREVCGPGGTAAPSPSPSVPPPPPPPASVSKACISGVVTRADTGAPVSAVVALAGPANRTVATDGAGAYTACELPVGNYSITPQAPNFTMVPLIRNVVLPPSGLASQDFRAAVGGVCIRGQVTTPAGASEPVTGATLTLNDGRKAFSEANGEYSFCGTPPGTYRVTASYPDAQSIGPAFEDATVPPEATGKNFTVVLPITTCVAGEVTTPSGASDPLVGISLEGRQGQPAVTGAGGRYRICMSGPDWEVRVTQPGYLWFPAAKSGSARGEVTGVNFAGDLIRPPKHTISGQVTGPQGAANPIAGATVRISGPEVRISGTDDSGKYEAKDLPEGVYTISVLLRENECGSRTVDLRQAETRLDITCVPPPPPDCSSPDYPLSPTDTGNVPPDQPVTLRWPGQTNCKYFVQLTECEYRSSGLLAAPEWTIGPYPAGQRCLWWVQAVGANGGTSPTRGQWTFTFGFQTPTPSPSPSPIPPTPTPPPVTPTPVTPTPVTPTPVTPTPVTPTPVTPTPVTPTQPPFVATVETKAIPPAYTVSESWLTFGAYVDVNPSDAKWQGRTVRVKVRLHTRAGQPGAARIFVQDRGPVLIEIGLNEQSPDQWQEFEFVALPGWNRYELEYHGHIGWSPNIEVVEGTFTITNE